MKTTLSLPAKCDTAAADWLLEEIKARRGAALCIDAQGCSGLGALCAAILVSAQQAWYKDGLDLGFIGAGNLAADLELMGLADTLLGMELAK
jgi:anti-anti-sigma regulatory factor